MCILFFQLNDVATEDGYRLILASNRDEYWVRPTGPAEWQQGGWLGGIDLEPGKRGGTWLGMKKSGKIAILLNVISQFDPVKKTRGKLVTDYLEGERLADDYLKEVFSDGPKYNPFHLYLIDLRSQDRPIHYLTNKGEEKVPKTLNPGLHSCANNICGGPWQKTVIGQKTFTDVLTKFSHVQQKDELLNSLFCFLANRKQYFPDENLQTQFADVERKTTGEVIEERSAVFVWSPSISYGTRTHTVILVDHKGNCDYIERTMATPVDVSDPQWTSVTHTFSLNTAEAEF